MKLFGFYLTLQESVMLVVGVLLLCLIAHIIWCNWNYNDLDRWLCEDEDDIKSNKSRITKLEEKVRKLEKQLNND